MVSCDGWLGVWGAVSETRREAHSTNWTRSDLCFSSFGLMSCEMTRSISATFTSFFWIVFCAFSFLFWNMRVPAASSIIPSTSTGFMLITLAMRPCMIRKCGLLTLSWTEWYRFITRCSCAVVPLIMYLERPPSTIWRVTVICACDS